MKHLSLVAVVSLLLAGCTPGAEAVQARAARDLGCPAAQVKVTETSLVAGQLEARAPSAALYTASGCGKQQVYEVKQGRITVVSTWGAPGAH